jgi:hypothetical protein
VNGGGGCCCCCGDEVEVELEVVDLSPLSLPPNIEDMIDPVPPDAFEEVADVMVAFGSGWL